MRRTSVEVMAGLGTAALATVLYTVARDEQTAWASSLPGQLLGVVGLLLMGWASFGYSARKRRQAAGATAMRVAMASHIVAGLLGPFLVILHSGFAFRGLAGVLALVMLLIVASGIVGRAIYTAVPRRVELGDPVRAAMLDARLAKLEAEGAELMRAGDPDPERREALRRQMTALHHEESVLRDDWQQQGSGLRWRRILGVWWFLHIPASAALWVLAAAHVLAATYYATLSR